MNLLTKITILNLLLALLAFSIGGTRVYHRFRFEVQRETDFTLKESFDELEASISSGVKAEDLENRFMRITPVSPELLDTAMILSDTIAEHPILCKTELFRKLVTHRSIAGQSYRFMVMNVIIEQSDIKRIAQHILKDLFIILGFIILVFNFIFLKIMLRPFKITIEKIRAFSLQSNETPVFSKTTTSEFQQLNDFLSTMLQKNQQDYRTLKEFSENASHEIQTPLAIANGKLELLIETPGLTNIQLQLVEETRDALSRLSKLGESLLLLTKIDNQEFATHTPLDFSELLKKEISLFEELATMKGLRFSSVVAPAVQVRMEASLARILLSNLLKNAIRHNVDHGWINIELEPRALRIRNSGTEPPVPTSQLFQRFQKSNGSGKSLGLGLAIAKKICEVSGFRIYYQYEDGVHTIRVEF